MALFGICRLILSARRAEAVSVQAVLAREAPSARQHCLHAYAAVGAFSGAEQVRSLQPCRSPGVHGSGTPAGPRLCQRACHQAEPAVVCHRWCAMCW